MLELKNTKCLENKRFSFIYELLKYVLGIKKILNFSLKALYENNFLMIYSHAFFFQ